jgi:hypothetical protein
VTVEYLKANFGFSREQASRVFNLSAAAVVFSDSSPHILNALRDASRDPTVEITVSPANVSQAVFLVRHFDRYGQYAKRELLNFVVLAPMRDGTWRVICGDNRRSLGALMTTILSAFRSAAGQEPSGLRHYSATHLAEDLPLAYSAAWHFTSNPATTSSRAQLYVETLTRWNISSQSMDTALADLNLETPRTIHLLTTEATAINQRSVKVLVTSTPVRFPMPQYQQCLSLHGETLPSVLVINEDNPGIPA